MEARVPFQAGREPLLQERFEYSGLEHWTLEAAAAADWAVVVLAFVTRSAA